MSAADKFRLEAENQTEGPNRASSKPPQERDPLADSGTARPAFAKALIDWFQAEGRDYPWRRTRDPYAVLVSEVMLQQTQIATVLSRSYFERWLERFPDVPSLAAADDDEVLKAWEGLGYYRRARNLQRAAQVVVDQHGGQMPGQAAKLRGLPGVGRYTAGAVACFAADEAEPIVDGNIARILARVFDFKQEIDGGPGQRQLWDWAGALLPAADVRDYNSGLMELGQRICRKGSPECARCPVATFCATREPRELPRKKATARIEQVVEHAALVVDAHGRVCLEQEPVGGRREGLWKLPALDLQQTPKPPGAELLRLHYGITRFRVELVVYRCEEVALPASDVTRHWFDAAALEAVAMPAPYRRALGRLLG